MFDKERLLSISELDGEKTAKITEDQMGDFAISANSLIDNLPTLAGNIKTALDGKDRAALSKALVDVCGILQSIFAEKLSMSCLNRIENINSAQEEDLQAFVIDFLKSVSALSIDLQMSKYRKTSEQPPENAASAIEPAAKNSILAVDDRHFFLTAIKTMLQGTGYKVTCVNSGAAALKYLNKNKPDLFIFDIEMPEMDGYELAKRVRESGQTSPIIFLTGNADKDSVVKALQAGAADFIVKPISKEQLLERIGKYVAPEITED